MGMHKKYFKRQHKAPNTFDLSKKSLPHVITCMNVAAGVLACIFGISGSYTTALYCIFAAAVFDFFDGLVARLLRVNSPFGKELDSLADVVSFGLAPALALYQLLKSQFPDIGGFSFLFFIPVLAVPVCSAVRLAKFNIDERQGTSFIGLPVPAHAVMWSPFICAVGGTYLPAGLVPINFQSIPDFVLFAMLTVLPVLTALLMVSELPMFSLKVKSKADRETKFIIYLAVATVVLLVLFGVAGISLAVVFYILLCYYEDVFFYVIDGFYEYGKDSELLANE
jgi:CDP-diacylglycerol--serine O-phosphatidyltransferase